MRLLVVSLVAGVTLTASPLPAAAAPANDARASATPIRGMSSEDFPDVVTASSLGATREAGEPDHVGEPGGASVWFSYFPYRGGATMSFDTVGSSFDTVLAVYSRSGSSLVPVVADNGSAGGGASRVSFPADYQEYLVAVDGVGGASGAIALRWFLTPPANETSRRPPWCRGRPAR